MQASNLFSPRWRKELFAELDTNARVYRAHHAVPKRYLDLVKRQTIPGDYTFCGRCTHLASNGLHDTR